MGVLENSKLQKRVLIKKREKHMRYYFNLEFLVTNKNRGLYQQNKDFVAGVLFCYALLSFQRTEQPLFFVLQKQHRWCFPTSANLVSVLAKIK